MKTMPDPTEPEERYGKEVLDILDLSTDEWKIYL
jgi:hypothetical protein